MAKERTIEEESGVITRIRHRHPHNGYYAGDFTNAPFHDPYGDSFTSAVVASPSAQTRIR